MKALRIVALFAIVGLATVAHAAPLSGSGGYGMSAEVAVTNLGGGQWEYQYDLFLHGDYMYYDFLKLNFEFGDGGSAVDHIQNMYDPGTGLELREFWTAQGITGNHGGEGWYSEVQSGVQASYGDRATDAWIISPGAVQAADEAWIVDPTYAAAEGFANPFHVPSDYAHHAGSPWHPGYPAGDTAFGLFAGTPQDADGDSLADDLFFDMEWFFGGHIFNGWDGPPELVATFRIVSDLGPYGEMQFQSISSGGITVSPIVGPGVPEPATMSLLALGGLAVLRRRRK
jgi:hypothetical protein